MDVPPEASLGEHGTEADGLLNKCFEAHFVINLQRRGLRLPQWQEARRYMLAQGSRS